MNERSLCAATAPASRRAFLFAAVVASLACAPWSWIVDGLTPSWVVYPIVLLVGAWRMRSGKGALLLAIAATVFWVFHLSWAWTAFTGERSGLLPDDLAIHRFEWAVTLSLVPLLTSVAAVAAWRGSRANARSAIGLGLAAATVILGGCADGSVGNAPQAETLARDLTRTGVRDVLVLVSDDGGEHWATAGARRPPKDARFRIGSVTKTFTATIVLQLGEERRIGLDDTLEQHLPGVVPRGDEITMRQLLNHRSGLADVTDYSTWLGRASSSRSLRPIDTLRFAASLPLAFRPGTRWRYSNTNYIALGLVVERVTGRPYKDELYRRILEPLGLDRTELPERRVLPDLDDGGENPNLPWAAGALVSNAPDLARFFRALLSGRILAADSLAEMKETVAAWRGTGDGLGLFLTRLPCGRFWGHDGGILDYGTIVRASDDGARVVVISARGGTPSGPPPDEAALLCPRTS